jgi:hypothetical protein
VPEPVYQLPALYAKGVIYATTKGAVDICPTTLCFLK